MKTINFFLMTSIFCLLGSCNQKQLENEAPDFKFQVDQFADLKVMRYQIPGFEQLTVKQKELVYYLSQSALAGRDIIFDQNYRHNLSIRRTLEAIVENYKGDRQTDDFKKFMIYVKRVWFSNGIHHHYACDKFIPDITPTYFAELIKNSPEAKFPLKKNESIDQFLKRMVPLVFDKNIDNKRISLDSSKDLITSSSCNYYQGVTQKEVEAFYAKMIDKADTQPISYGLNSKLVKEKGHLVEKVYKLGGMYSPAIEKILFWLEKAMQVTENEQQKAWIEKLSEYYKTGDLKLWDEYNILWVQDTTSLVDLTNGFIEIYGDPLGIKASWESVVSFKNIEATKRTKVISDNAQWFEDHSPIDARFKKDSVKGVSAKVITVAQLGGDCFPSTPIGINLPNADWIRKTYGSKSVTMENITYAYNQAALGNGFLEEFASSPEEITRQKEYGAYADNLHTDMHECLGHGSGQLLPGITTDVLKNYYNTLEEARADLFGLYFIMDPKMIEIGLFSSVDGPKTAYDSYIRNGLIGQLVRIELGKDIEEAHMRNRKLIAEWVYEKGKPENVIEKFIRDGKTFVKINDYDKLRVLFGQLLAEIQRIKSTGDYEAAKNLVETFAVKIDPVLHKEILNRYNKLNLAPYGGFMNPVLTPVYQGKQMMDVQVEYPEDYVKQMMDYSKNYSFLPNYN